MRISCFLYLLSAEWWLLFICMTWALPLLSVHGGKSLSKLSTPMIYFGLSVRKMSFFPPSEVVWTMVLVQRMLQLHCNMVTGTSFKHRYTALFSLVWNLMPCSKLALSEVMSHLSKPPKGNTALTAQLQLSVFSSVASVFTGPVTKITGILDKFRNGTEGPVQ